MNRKIELLAKNNSRKEMTVQLALGKDKKQVVIKDHKDDAENFRAMCRALHTFEKELQIKN